MKVAWASLRASGSSLLAACLSVGPVLASGGDDRVLEPFLQLGVGQLDRPRAFDRLTPASGKGPAMVPGIGATVRVSSELDAAGIWLRGIDVNDDGADVDFFLGELRQRLSDVRGGWVGIGGGRVRGSERKESWVQTLAFGKDLGAGLAGELRWISDEGAGRMMTVGLSWRFRAVR